MFSERTLVKEFVLVGLVLVLACGGSWQWMFPPGTIRLENATGQPAYQVYVLYPGGSLTAAALAPGETISKWYAAAGDGELTLLVRKGQQFDQVAIDSYVCNGLNPDFDLRLTALDPLEVEDRSAGERVRRYRAKPRPTESDR